MLLEKQEITGVKLVGSGRTLGPLELNRCVFNGSVLAQFDDPDLGLVVRDVTARRCRVNRSGAQGVRFEDVHIDGLAVTSLLHLNACVFKHVTLTGNIGPLMATPPNYALSVDLRDRFRAQIIAYYAGVDWALDISQAAFSEADFYYVPGHLIRRDEETQFLLHRDRAEHFGDLKKLPDFARFAVSRFEATPFDTLVAIAPKRSKNFTTWLAELQILRTEGLAD
ncbi:hypothetical protein [Streptacidiphilus albus]|uniref:hypothetical protein n=1 Tax=Streptacidiphilus albus TaxID=105425 RepID=UPI000691FB8C|nr:hypothetical protein [Streptacidiphilus albus]